ncbi:MAG: hypothetical protein AAF349_24585, partial [Cyanobacteria bacterium P01_A01_bin.68]
TTSTIASSSLYSIRIHLVGAKKLWRDSVTPTARLASVTWMVGPLSRAGSILTAVCAGPLSLIATPKG